MQTPNNAPYQAQPGAPAAQGFNAYAGRAPRWDNGIRWYEIPAAGQWVCLRFLGPLYMVAVHWIETRSGKKFPQFCLDFDSPTSAFNYGTCPVCKLEPKASPDKRIKDLTPRLQGYIHCIVRETQLMQPTRLPISAIMGIRRQGKLNQHTINGQIVEVDVTDPQYGRDINIFHDKQAEAANRYTIALGNPSPLQQHEMEYLKQLTDWAGKIVLPTAQEMREALQKNGYYGNAAVGVPDGCPQGQPGQVPQGYGQGMSAQAMLPGVPQPPTIQVPPPPSYAQPQMPPPGYAPPPQAPMPAYAPPVAPAPVAALPPLGTYAPPPQAPAPQAWAPPAQTVAPVPQQQWQQPAPPPPPQAPAPQAWTPPPQQAPAPMAFQQPMTPALQQAVGEVVVQAADPAAAGTDKKFPIVGKPGGVGIEEFKAHVAAFCQPIPRAMPLMVWNRDEMAGVPVPKCFSGYLADGDCLKCPVRRYCLQY